MTRRGPPSIPILEHINTLLGEMDLRYQQRYDAQIKALDAALLAAEKAVQTALTAAEKAVTKAEMAAEKRFESVNEFRMTLSDQATTFISRVEFEALRDASAERIRELAARVDKTEGRSTGLANGWGVLVGAIGIVAALVAVVVQLN